MTDALSSIVVLVAFLALASVPLLIFYFLSNRDWRFKKLSAQQIKQETIKNTRDWRMLGCILILLSSGASFEPFARFAPDISALPWYLKALAFAFGVALVLASNHSEKKLTSS